MNFTDQDGSPGHLYEPDLLRLREIGARINAAAETTADGEDEREARERMVEADLAELADMQAMAKDFAGWLHRKGAEAMEAEGKNSAERVAALSSAFNKAARAMRQIVVLKHEVAGLRPCAHARPVAAAVNPNRGRGGAKGSARSRGGHDDRTRSDIDDYDEYSDGYNKYFTEELLHAEQRAEAWWDYVRPAVDADLIAGGLGHEVGNSRNLKLKKLIPTIPHPEFDKAILEVEHARIASLYDLVKDDKPGYDPPE
jgi:hypothetical protein